ncbi:type 1 glutamine amidotransferase [Gymnodinialimonas ceratoperidinii]|uniref:Type 1 glutamine amidotransferase n=1 Tax=Gymnodinialimonas ceratoperidinii TaxID=2856823 RepID=A0A8F6TWI1_9RHOB|nr:type 1 glutamine amidotransferase [Gymnodinialimonas ceratoperidinii]QXT39209.1 type 1 glutamine amidotransferase [Gymnodinialimonas ceratoperidinii]
MHLGILQTGHVPDEVARTDGPYATLFHDLFAHRGFTQTLWSVVDGDFPDSPQAADAWLVTGSKHGAYEDHPWIPPLEDFIRAIQDAEIPLVGSCFGHQIIAQALGGKVEKFPNGWSVGRTEYRIGDQTLNLNAWHQDQVTRLPEGTTVHGASDFCAHAVIAIGPRILSTQPHPEFENSVIATLIDLKGDVVEPERVEAAQAALDKPNDNRLIADWMADVLEGADATQPRDFSK